MQYTVYLTDAVKTFQHWTGCSVPSASWRWCLHVMQWA